MDKRSLSSATRFPYATPIDGSWDRHTPGEGQYAAALGLYLDTLRASDLTYGARTSIIGAGDDLVRLLRAAISPGEAQSGREELTDAAGGEPRTPATLGAVHRVSGEGWLSYWAAQ